MCMCVCVCLFPTGSEEREVLGIGSISVAILPSCQVIKTIAFYVHKQEYSWAVKIRNRSEATIHPLATILTAALWALVFLISSYMS